MIVDRFAAALSSFPSAAVSLDRIGSAEPNSSGQLPRLVLSVQIADRRGTGLARFSRAGDILVQQRTIVDVAASQDTFSADLRTLKLAPLPLKKNPSAPPGAFGPADVAVSDVSGASPVAYSLVASPTRTTEFSLDPVRATLTFGTRQPAGHKLDVSHWTVQWRDDITVTRVRGRLCLDLWANDAIQLDGIARQVTDSVFNGADVFRQSSFPRLSLMQLDSIVNVLQQPPAGTAFAVWKQRIDCEFVFEHEPTGEASQGIPIKQINVEPQGFVRETLTIR
jgi:hypothetical protein